MNKTKSELDGLNAILSHLKSGEIFKKVSSIDMEHLEQVINRLVDIGESINSLAINQNQLEEAQALAKMGNWSFDLSTGKIFWSKQLYELHPVLPGSEPPNFESLCQMIHPDDRESFKKLVEACASQGKPYRSIHRIVFPDKVLWMEGMGSAKRDANGNIIGLIGTAQDISERVEAELSAEKDKAQLQALFLQSADPIMTLSPPNWKFTACNPAALKLFEVETEEKFRSLGPWDLSPQSQPTGESSAAMAKRAIGIAMEQGSYFFEWEHQTLKGKKVSCTVLLSRVRLKSDTYLQASVRDISKEKQFLEDINEKALEKKTILDTMAEGLVIQDKDGIIVNFNPAALSILGLTEDELLGRTSLDPHRSATKDDGSPFLGHEHPAMLALKTGQAVKNIPMGLTLKDGTKRWIKINAVPYESKGGRRVTCSFSDISEEVNHNSDMKHIFGLSTYLMFIAGTDGTFKKLSPSFFKILGFSEEGLLSKPFMDLIHPDDIKPTKKVVESLSQGNRLINFENRYRAKDGSYRRINWVCELDTNTGMLYATGRDVTEKRLEEFKNNQIFEAIDQTAIVAFTDVNGKITRVNQRFCALSGYSENELIGKDHRILNSGKHPKSFFKEMWTSIKSGKSWTADIENRNKNGEPYFLRTVISPIKNLEGKIEQFISIRFDITEQKRAEKTLETKAAEMQTLMDGIPALVSHWDSDLKNLTANNGYANVFGISPEQMKGRHYKNIVGPLYAKIKPSIDQALSGQSNTIETVTKLPNGQDSYRQITFHPDFKEGTICGIFTVALDITKEKLLEMDQKVNKIKLQESEAQLKLILNSTQHGIWGLDLNGHITFINRSALRLLGYQDESEISGKTIHELVHGNSAEKFSHSVKNCYLHDSVFRQVTQYGVDDILTKKDGSTFPISYYSTPIKIEGICVGSVASFEDMTERRALETSLNAERLKSVHSAKLASLGEMSAGIAHEINNPLAIITGSIGLLKKYRDTPEKFEQKAESILKATARIEKIVKGLKKFSRSSDANIHSLENLDEIISEILTLVEVKSKRHGVKILTEVTPNIKIKCDAVEIEQVLINLVNNSIDAIKDKAERWVKINCFQSKDGIPTLQVIDSGTGISDSTENKLFQPFFTTKPVGEGTGLGLSISKGILDQHQATIALNKEFKNTCFEIRFAPLEKDKKAA